MMARISVAFVRGALGALLLGIGLATILMIVWISMWANFSNFDLIAASREDQLFDALGYYVAVTLSALLVFVGSKLVREGWPK